MERKAKKMATRAMGNVCKDDAKCAEWLAETIHLCSSQIALTRADKGASNLGAKDQRKMLACLQKSQMKHSCAEGNAKCLSRIDNRYDSCFDYAYPLKQAPAPDAASDLVGCLYGVKFESRDTAAIGFSAEEVTFDNRKAVPMDRASGKLTDDVVDELTREFRKLGDDRKQNFDEAMSALHSGSGNPENSTD